ncbi:hypothetical protein CQ018_12865 [Arthrobacter sp. MYb227]|uniref:DUF2087 domain-containing protein n=1 Tax=Arthrobacter sp. MYb227 TaxID=1848601 RepID=UPI000CFB4E20|nr:DUF2087 domain-containing protein [Arthrobacter sp. MYb227]PQZ91537.1 hypothetical protein CQ018_12865 [Arthrobacter sp. MYb227]
MKESLTNNPTDWRRIFGALANEDTRRAYAQAILGIETDGSSIKQAKALKNLRSAGLLDEDGKPDEGVFTRALAQIASTTPKEGVQRFLDADGRIERYPKAYGERVGLLRHVGSQILKHGEELTETDLTLRLEEISDDAVLLRRYLVDYGVVIRRPDGSIYRLADGSD